MDPELTAVFREMLRQFVATEIEVGMTFAGLRRRSTPKGDRIEAARSRRRLNKRTRRPSAGWRTPRRVAGR